MPVQKSLETYRMHLLCRSVQIIGKKTDDSLNEYHSHYKFL